MSLTKRLLRRVARVIFPGYALYWVLEQKLGPDLDSDPHGVSQVSTGLAELLETPHEEVRRTIDYAGSESVGFCISKDGHVVAVCWFWWGARYAVRNFWPLRPTDAKLVHIVVADSYRGQGIASTLLSAASAAMAGLGFERLYARVWHSNKPSLHAFAKAGWTKHAFVAELTYREHRRPLRLQWPRRSRDT